MNNFKEINDQIENNTQLTNREISLIIRSLEAEIIQTKLLGLLLNQQELETIIKKVYGFFQD